MFNIYKKNELDKSVQNRIAWQVMCNLIHKNLITIKDKFRATFLKCQAKIR